MNQSPECRHWGEEEGDGTARNSQAKYRAQGEGRFSIRGLRLHRMRRPFRELRTPWKPAPARSMDKEVMFFVFKELSAHAYGDYLIVPDIISLADGLNQVVSKVSCLLRNFSS